MDITYPKLARHRRLVLELQISTSFTMYRYILMTTNYYSCGVADLFNILPYVDDILKPQ